MQTSNSESDSSQLPQPANWVSSDVFAAGVIREIELIPLRLPFKTDFKIAFGAPRPGIDILVLKMHTESGLVGIGETQAWLRQGSRDTLRSLISVIQEQFSPRLIGKNVFNHARLLAELRESVWGSNYAQAPVADAMLDLQGKILGVPAYQLLGGKSRDSVCAGITLGISQDVEALLDDVRKWLEQGFTSFTIKVGNDPDRDAGVVEKVVEAFSDQAIIRADGNSGMDWAGALRFMNRIQHLGLDAVEQLLPPSDMDGMAELARRYNVPIMADEMVSYDHDLLKVISKNAASVFQTKIAKNGGAWACKRLWEIGSAAGMRIFPGNHPGASVVSAAALHLATSWPGPLLEGPIAVGINEVLAEDIIAEPIPRKGKRLFIGDAPGLGVVLDENKLKGFRVER
ncbi:MAG: mandelate racemase/muconate lactonizing enzyme family protein [Alcaligenaceae bacterium]|nr:mandelate racemase/muconate lactonizing enzyme family protein [Alcaligenaceae bacterium]